MNYIECECFLCKTKFKKIVSEYNRTVKRKKRHFCSKDCSSSIAAKENFANGIFKPRPENLQKGKKQDQFSSFRWYLARVRTRVKERGKANDLTLVYLKQIWDNQKGICPFTGWEMELPLGTVKWSSLKNPKRASLDRIDCSKGYIQGNVRFVSVIANYARNNFDDKEVIEFCKAVTEKEKEKQMALSIKFKKPVTMRLFMCVNSPDGINHNEGLLQDIHMNAGDVLKIKEYEKIDQSLIIKIDEYKNKYGYSGQYVLDALDNGQKIDDLVEIIE